MANKAVFPWDTPNDEPPIDANLDTPSDRIIMFFGGLIIVYFIWFSEGFTWPALLGAFLSVTYLLLMVLAR